MDTNAFRALRAPYRRRLLLALLESNPRSVDDLCALDPGLDGPSSEGTDGGRIELHHVHLPALDDWGYVDWDRETGRVVEGPNWAEVAPILHLLRDDADERSA